MSNYEIEEDALKFFHICLRVELCCHEDATRGGAKDEKEVLDCLTCDHYDHCVVCCLI